VFVLLLVPLAWTAAAYAHKYSSWPTVLGERYRLERVFLAAYNSRIDIVPVPATWRLDDNDTAFLLSHDDCDQCGILIQELNLDWRGYNSVCVDISNPDKDSLLVSAQFGDALMFFRSSGSYKTTVTFGANARSTQCIAIPDLARSPVAKVAVQSLALLVSESSGRREFFVHRLWLQ
jgi:hypothetical protein